MVRGLPDGLVGVGTALATAGATFLMVGWGVGAADWTGLAHRATQASQARKLEVQVHMALDSCSRFGSDQGDVIGEDEGASCCWVEVSTHFSLHVGQSLLSYSKD